MSLVELPAAELATRLRAGDYTAAVVDISTGLEPDLYPLLASSQVRASGMNLSGYQDPALDKLLVAARTPGTPEVAIRRVEGAAGGDHQRMPILPLAWADEVFLERGVSGPDPAAHRGPGRPVWGCASMAPRRGPVSLRAPRSARRILAEVAKLADALASGASARKGVWVQVPSSVPRSLLERIPASAQ